MSDPISVESLTTPVTDEQAQASILEVATDLELPTTSWHEGSITRTLIAIFARLISTISILISDINKAGLLDFSTGKWLTLYARTGFNVERILATFATGEVTITNGGVGNVTITAGDIHLANSLTGKTYAVEGPAVDGEDNIIGAGLSKKFVCIADEAGSASNANPDEITEFVTSVLNLTATNAKAVVGLDEETDPNLRQRCKDKLAALSPNGAAAAYAYFAKSATRADGTPIGITRVKVNGDSSNGQVLIYVATPTGTVSGDPDDPDTDLGAVNYLLQTKVVPTGITMSILSASTISIAVTCTLYVAKESTLTEEEHKTAAVKRLTSYFSNIPIGGFDIGAGGRVFKDAIIGQLYGSAANIVEVTVSAPVGDVTMGDGDVPVNTTVNADVTIVQLDS